MHNLAVSVSGRDGSPPDYTLAAKWYEEAASYDLPDSQFNLGVLAEHGLGMQKDLAAAGWAEADLPDYHPAGRVHGGGVNREGC